MSIFNPSSPAAQDGRTGPRFRTMLTALGLALLTAVGLLVGACDEGIPAPSRGQELPPFDPETCSLLDLPEPEIHDTAHTTGPTNESIVATETALWVVHTGDGTIGRLDDDGFDAEWAHIGNNRLAQGVFEHSGRLYIPTWWANGQGDDSIVVVDIATGDVVGEVSEGCNDPDDIVAVGDYLLVAQSAYDGGLWLEGFVSLYHLDDAGIPSFVESLPMGVPNTRSLTLVPSREQILVTSTGSFGSGEDGWAGSSSGSVSVLDINRLADGLEAAETARIPLPLNPEDPFSGTPGRPAITPDAASAYFPSSSSPELYKLDLETHEWERDTHSPIEAYRGDGNQLTSIAIREDGVGFVLAFNQNALYLFDPTCDASIKGPYDLAHSADLAGPGDLGFDNDGMAYVLMKLSNAITTVTIPRVE